MFKFGSFPLGLGNHLSFTVHAPMKVSEYDFETLLEKAEQAVVSKITV
jgi:1-acyl-sn-glycerol-3-phosphate acyltransferase